MQQYLSADISNEVVGFVLTPTTVTISVCICNNVLYNIIYLREGCITFVYTKYIVCKKCVCT